MTESKARSTLELVVAALSGATFAVGLAVGGMTEPARVLAFLDVTGAWDPSLMFVMMGAIAVTFTAFRLAKGRAAPLFGGVFHIPTRRDLDPRLLLGAALFGVGWGTAGYCPGPGLASLSTGGVAAAAFVLSMAVGMRAYDAADAARLAKRTPQ